MSNKNGKRRKRALTATIQSLLFGFYKLRFALGGKIAPRQTAVAGAKLFCTPIRPAAGKFALPADFPAPRVREMTLPSGTVFIYEWGDTASSRTVFLIHGWNGWGLQLAHFIPALLGLGFAVITADQVAHGRSPGKHSSLPLFIDTVRELLERLPNVSSVVAHSLGAAAIANVLAQSGKHALDVVLIAPPRGPRVFVEKFAAMLGIPYRLVDGMQEFIERRYGRSFNQVGADAVAPEMRARTLIIHDPDDDVVPFAHGECYARLAPRATLTPLHGWGHYRILRSPQAIGMTADFLAAQAAPHDYNGGIPRTERYG